MNFENLLVEKSEFYAVVTINRPDKLNALNTGTVEELGQAVEDKHRRERRRRLPAQPPQRRRRRRNLRHRHHLVAGRPIQLPFREEHGRRQRQQPRQRQALPAHRQQVRGEGPAGDGAEARPDRRKRGKPQRDGLGGR